MTPPSPQARRGSIFDSDYKKAVKKGQFLMHCVDVFPSSAKEDQFTPWEKWEDLKAWGWELDQQFKDYSQYWRLTAYEVFEFENLTMGDNIMWYHESFAHRDEGQYPPTNAIYNNVFYPEKGIIIANNNYSPIHMINSGQTELKPWKDEDTGKPFPMIELKRWSNVAFLCWQHLTTPEQRRNLKWIIRSRCINMPTLKMITKIMQKRGIPGREHTRDDTKLLRAPNWPGFTLENGEEAFDALVAMPVCHGVAWMLIQHETGLGRKTIKSITVFDEDRSEDSYGPSLILKLGQAGGVYEGT